MKKVLFIVQAAPYGSGGIPESARTCLGFATMPFEVSYLLMGDATWVLLPNQRPETIGSAGLLALVSGLSELGVELYAEAEAIEARGLDPGLAAPGLELLAAEQIADLIASADSVLTY